MNTDRISVLYIFKLLYRDWIRPEISDIQIVRCREEIFFQINILSESMFKLQLNNFIDTYYVSQTQFFDQNASVKDLEKRLLNMEYRELLDELFNNYIKPEEVAILQRVFTEEAIDRIDFHLQNKIDHNLFVSKCDFINQGKWIIELNWDLAFVTSQEKKLISFSNQQSLIDALIYHLPLITSGLATFSEKDKISDINSEIQESLNIMFNNWQKTQDCSELVSKYSVAEKKSLSSYNILLMWFGSLSNYYNDATEYSKYVKSICSSGKEEFLSFLQDDDWLRNRYYQEIYLFLEMPYETTMDMNEDEKRSFFEYLEERLYSLIEIMNTSEAKYIKELWSLKLEDAKTQIAWLK